MLKEKPGTCLYEENYYTEDIIQTQDNTKDTSIKQINKVSNKKSTKKLTKEADNKSIKVIDKILINKLDNSSINELDNSLINNKVNNKLINELDNSSINELDNSSVNKEVKVSHSNTKDETVNESNSSTKNETVNESNSSTKNESKSDYKSKYESDYESGNEDNNLTSKDKHYYKIKQLNNWFKKIGQTKSLEEQIEILKTKDFLYEYWSLKYYNDNKDLNYKIFKAKAAYLLTGLDKKIF